MTSSFRKLIVTFLSTVLPLVLLSCGGGGGGSQTGGSTSTPAGPPASQGGGASVEGGAPGGEEVLDGGGEANLQPPGDDGAAPDDGDDEEEGDLGRGDGGGGDVPLPAGGGGVEPGGGGQDGGEPGGGGQDDGDQGGGVEPGGGGVEPGGGGGGGGGGGNDGDSDGIDDERDNCPIVANPGQEDIDGDRLGDACDEGGDQGGGGEPGGGGQDGGGGVEPGGDGQDDGDQDGGDQGGGVEEIPPPPRIVLERCGVPQEGWINGATYFLQRDLRAAESLQGNSCFPFNGAENITFDCQTTTIDGAGTPSGTTAISLKNTNGMTIQNCTIRNFSKALNIEETTRSFFHKNILINNAYGFGMSGGSHNNLFTHNNFCSNRNKDWSCKNSNDTVGEGNLAAKFESSCPLIPSQPLVSICPEDLVGPGAGGGGVEPGGGGQDGGDQGGGEEIPPPPRIVLERCGVPQGGWINGATYFLQRDLRAAESLQGNSCFPFANVENVTLDCQGVTLDGAGTPSGTKAITLNNVSDMTIQNCAIQNFFNAINIEGTTQSLFQKNILQNNAYGFGMSGGSHNNRFTHNNFCGNRNKDWSCKNSNDPVGEGNLAAKFESSCPLIPSQPLVSICPEALVGPRGGGERDLDDGADGGAENQGGGGEEIRPIPLARCGTPEEGWHNGATYTLSENLANAALESFCFHFQNNDNITLNCQGNTIDGNDPIDNPIASVVGIFVEESSGITVQNCTIQNFDLGIVEHNSEQSIFDRNILRDNTYGLQQFRSTQSNVVNNSFCYNYTSDWFCQSTQNNAGANNEANYFDAFDCQENWPQGAVGSECPADPRVGRFNGKPPIQLQRCGTPAGGWKEGQSYRLAQDIVMEEGLSECFRIERMNNIRFNCQDHTIRGNGDSTGFYLYRTRGVVLENCILRDHHAAIATRSASNGSIQTIEAKENQIGLNMNLGSHSNVVKGNVFCDNTTWDMRCELSQNNSGDRNQASRVTSSCENSWPSENAYEMCPVAAGGQGADQGGEEVAPAGAGGGEQGAGDQGGGGGVEPGGGQGAGEGAMAEEGLVVILNRCGNPANGWQPGKTYRIEENIQVPEGSNNCFDLIATNDITIDCGPEGRSIEGRRDPANPNQLFGIGINTNNSQNIVIRNCLIRNFDTAILLQETFDNEITNNTMSNNNIGLQMSEAHHNDIHNNFLCSNNFQDWECSRSRDNLGEENKADSAKVITNSCEGFPDQAMYESCVSGIELRRCGVPTGGWRNGETYVLTQDISENMGVGTTCFDFRQNAHITLDCRGHTLDGSGGVKGVKSLNGILIQNSSHMRITNCALRNFEKGILARATTQSSFIRNAAYNCGFGLAMGGDSNSNLVSENNFCSNRIDWSCQNSENNFGAANRADQISTTCQNDNSRWPEENVTYEHCPLRPLP